MSRLPRITPVYRTRQARQDIVELLTYLYAHNAAAGDVVSERLESAIEALRMFPLSGHVLDLSEVASDLPEIRALNVKGYPYLVLYHVSAEAVHIDRVLDGRRDIPAVLQDEFLGEG